MEIIVKPNVCDARKTDANVLHEQVETIIRDNRNYLYRLWNTLQSKVRKGQWLGLPTGKYQVILHLEKKLEIPYSLDTNVVIDFFKDKGFKVYSELHKHDNNEDLILIF